MLILILILILVFGGGFGYHRDGYSGTATEGMALSVSSF
jgi:hypothetical protein